MEEEWPALATLLARTPPADLAATTRRLLADEGITYRPPGEDEQPWALDPLPLPITAATWAELEAGVAQRALLFERLLADLYGADTAAQIRLQYGGSVKPDNAAELMGMEDIDGALVGGASLQADSFLALVKNGSGQA